VDEAVIAHAVAALVVNGLEPVEVEDGQ